MNRLERGLDRAKQTSEAVAAYGFLAGIIPLFLLNKVVVTAPRRKKIIGKIVNSRDGLSSKDRLEVDERTNSITIPDGSTATVILIERGKTTVEGIILDYTRKYKNGHKALVKVDGKIRSKGRGQVPVMKGGNIIELNPAKSTHRLEDGTVISWSDC